MSSRAERSCTKARKREGKMRQMARTMPACLSSQGAKGLRRNWRRSSGVRKATASQGAAARNWISRSNAPTRMEAVVNMAAQPFADTGSMTDDETGIAGGRHVLGADLADARSEVPAQRRQEALDGRDLTLDGQL